MMRAHQGISIRPNRHDVYLTTLESLAKKLQSFIFLCARYIYSQCTVSISSPWIHNIFQKTEVFFVLFLNCFELTFYREGARKSSEGSTTCRITTEDIKY